MVDSAAITAEFKTLTAVICDRLAANQRVRRNLPGGGRIRIDRQLPFLCVYRSTARKQDAGTRDLVTTEAAYLFAPGDAEYHEGLSHLCREIDAIIREIFGVFLLIEVWAKNDTNDTAATNDTTQFRIIAPDPELLPTAIESLRNSLSHIQFHGRHAQVALEPMEEVSPPGMAPLLSTSGGSFAVGLELSPIYRDPSTQVLFPIVLQEVRRKLARAIRRAVFAFTDAGLDDEAHFETFGPSALTRAARDVDQQLCEIASSFDFLLQVTPTNSADAWDKFQKNQFRDEPEFLYRPLPYHPNLIKRRLFDVPIERIEDSTLGHLCGEKQNELDRQLTALSDIGTPNFKYGSLQLYGPVEDWLFNLANDVLKLHAEELRVDQPDLTASEQIVNRAVAEFTYYSRYLPEFSSATVEYSDVAAGLMVSRDRLLISANLNLRPERLEALMHHEVGTHLLTYFNGKRQPFGQLSAGLAGYESLQEGLAVLAEILVGGMTASRWRSLAGRVVAVRMMCDGQSFLDVFHHLHEDHGFKSRLAFTIALRAFRGGGLTKDAIYLQGLHDLLRYLREGHDLEPLYVGKIGLHHVPYVRELRRRGVLEPPGALPRFWHDRGLRERLEICRNLSILQLAEQQL